MEDWEFSSLQDYVGMRNGTLCHNAMAFDLLNLDPVTLYFDSYQVINGNIGQISEANSVMVSYTLT